MLKIGQNWGKVANYPHQCSTKICTTDTKMPKDTEPEDTRLFCRISIIGGILIRGARVPCPLPPGYAYGPGLHCAGLLAFRRLSLHLSAKYTVGEDQKKTYNLSAGPLAGTAPYCNMVHPALVNALRS